MSLDSVELLVSFENYFGVSIPDQEAEKLYRVSDLCDSICHHLGITASHTTLRDDVFIVLTKAMQQIGIIDRNITLNDHLKDFFKYDPELWQTLERETGLRIPGFPTTTKNTFLGRLISRIAWQSQADYHTLNFSDFCDVICAANYQKFLNVKQLNSSYEVYIAVMAITEDKTGVDLYDIKPGKSFTTDFGID